MMTKPWFEKGKGWKILKPIAWQGWVIMSIFAFLIIYNFFRIDAASHSASDTLRPFILQTLFLIFIFVLTAKNLSRKN